MHKHRYDKLLKDEITFLRGELSRELRPNQKNNRSLARTALTLWNSSEKGR